MIQDFKILEETLLDPMVRNSSAKLNELIADEFIEYGSSGKVYNKVQVIDGLLNEIPFSYSIADFKQTVLTPDTVLATYQLVQQKNKNIESVASLRSSIWKLINDRWQIIFHQGTLIEISIAS
jgi:hypothetical protein